MNRTSGRNGTATSSPLGTAPKHRERIAFTMSSNENTASENRDVYACVTAQIIKRNRSGRREPAYALAPVRPLRLLPRQRNQQETSSWHQYPVPLGCAVPTVGSRRARDAFGYRSGICRRTNSWH